MPYEHPPSPVAPTATSRLWTAGASGGVAALILVGLAVLHPELAPSLIGGAVLVAASTWLISRSREPSPGVEPLAPVEMVVDHSVQVDVFGKPEALAENMKIEFERNQERYSFLRWGPKAFDNFKVVP
jgi:hypothetical protein